MDALTSKRFTTKSGFTYAYYVHAPTTGTKPTVLLLHGCPDTASMWSNLITAHLLPAGYGVVAPDLLGYGASDKPKEAEHYALNRITADVASIITHEKLEKVIALGHDFGAVTASRMANYFPERICGLVTLGTAYIPPSPEPFDFQKVRAMQEQNLGYCASWYFPLFMSADGAKKIDAHLEEMFTALHGGGKRMKEVLCIEGGIEKWLEGHNIAASGGDGPPKDAQVKPYAQKGNFKEEWIGRLKRDGWTCPLLWYKAVTGSFQLEADKEALGKGTHVINVPYLFIGAREDPLASPEAVKLPLGYGMLPDVTIKEVQAGHWCMMEKPDEVGGELTKWLGVWFSGEEKVDNGASN